MVHGSLSKKRTHVVLMKDLQNFVDVVERVHSGGASLFGLRGAETGQISALGAGIHNQYCQYCMK